MFRFGTRLFEIWGKLQTLPPSKISDIVRVGGRTVMSGVPNVGGIDFGERMGRRPWRMNASRRRLRLASW